jgi:MFS family permease
MSTNGGFLIAGRVLQGFGGALIMPAQSACVAVLFPPQKRGQISGIIVSVGAVFMILAPIIGGYLTESLAWRWIFWVNLPIAVIGLMMIRKFIPSIESSKKHIDFWGFLFFSITVFAITLLFMQANDWGWRSGKIAACLIAAILGAAALAFREKKAAHPFLDLSLYKMPKYSAITLNIGITQFVLMVTVFQTIYFQSVLGLTPVQTGMVQFVSGIPILLAPMIAGVLSDRVTPKLPIAIGYLSFIVSCLFLAFASAPSMFSLIAALMVFGISIPFIMTPSYSTAISILPPTKMGVGFGTLTTVRWFSGTLGFAMTQLFVASVQKYHTPIVGDRMAKMISFSWVHFALAMLMIVVFAITFILHNRKAAHQLPASPVEG